MSVATILFLLFSFIEPVNTVLAAVKIQTSLGKILIELDTVNAPVTAINFLEHVEKGTFDNALFYRVVRTDNQPRNDVKIEVIQGGLFTDKEIEKYPSIRHETTKETGLKHLDGTISMARMETGTASTEFFICIGDQPELDFGGNRNPDGQGFAAFGRVIDGMDVVRNIQKLPDNNQYLAEPVEIFSVELIK
jgi:peptidyl-prolyl cis-trans isomerase A (cyclophilin A)